MRWLTQDPLGFKESLNRYRFNKNNPNRYIDPDGRYAYPAFVLIVEFFTMTFGPATATTAACTITATEVAAVATVAVAGSVVASKSYQMYTENRDDAIAQGILDEEKDLINNGVPSTQNPVKLKPTTGRKAGNDNECVTGPPRDKNNDYNYIPDPGAEGHAHTTLGTQSGRFEEYLQGATFDDNGEFTWRTDCTDHGRPKDHVNPH